STAVEAILPPRAEHEDRALGREKPCRGFTQSAARAGDHDDLVFNVVDHDPDSSLCRDQARYCASLTCSIQSTTLPSSASAMAICVIAVVGAAPCQCFSPGANQMTSPGRICSTGPSSRCASPQPAGTIKVCPSGCVWQA